MVVQDIGLVKKMHTKDPSVVMFNLNNILVPIGEGTVVLLQDLDGVKYVVNIFGRVALDPETDKDSFLLTDEYKRQEILNSEMLGGKNYE